MVFGLQPIYTRRLASKINLERGVPGNISRQHLPGLKKNLRTLCGGPNFHWEALEERYLAATVQTVTLLVE